MLRVPPARISDQSPELAVADRAAGCDAPPEPFQLQTARSGRFGIALISLLSYACFRIRERLRPAGQRLTERLRASLEAVPSLKRKTGFLPEEFTDSRLDRIWK